MRNLNAIFALCAFGTAVICANAGFYGLAALCLAGACVFTGFWAKA